MNTILTQSLMPSKNAGITVDAVTDTSKLTRLQTERVSEKPDIYSATSANDAVVVTILSQSLHKSMGGDSSSMPIGNAKNLLSEKFELESSPENKQFDIKSVTDNVVGFVQKALTNLAQKGFDSEQLSFFRNQAITGVEVGIDQAKLELVGLVNEDVYKTIDDTKSAIIGGIYSLPVEPKEYQSSIRSQNINALDTQPALNAITLNTVSNTQVKIDFDNRVFNSAKAKTEDDTSKFTSSSSNISFAVKGQVSEPARQQIANLVNKVDGLANTFYRGNIESAYQKSIDSGYNDREMLVLAQQMNKMDNYQQMKIYGDIQHITDSGESDFTAPKAVAEYVNRYLDTLENSKSTLSSEEDFNQVINGLVNQMKDVQVPDLLQAINRFHTFNSIFRQ